MREKVELDKGLVLRLPNENEIFGTDNLKIFGSYIARSVGKIKRYLADDHVSLGEGIGMFRILRKGKKTKQQIDFDQLEREYNDLSQKEWDVLAEVVGEEYYAGLDGKDSLDGLTVGTAQSLIEDFFRTKRSLDSLFKDRV